jgi:UDP:flavonoid glycosyltransferase YjiC (YdhE family)
MRILLVTRGSQGDVYPYLAVAAELSNRGHEITLSVPQVFEEQAKAAGLNYYLQADDDIAGMIEGKPDTKALLDWTRRVIDSQFAEIIPRLKNYDLFISSNTEFAAPSIAEYCGIPFIRTAYAPLIPGGRVPPAVFPVKPRRRFVALQWKILNTGLNMMVRKTLNRNRARLNMDPIKDQGEYAPSHAYNYLMMSRYLGETDPDWKYPWAIGGYCFNDIFPYNEIAHRNFLEFVKQDSRPTLFFTLGSCNVNERDLFCDRLYRICRKYDYKLAVGCGWWKTGTHLNKQDRLFLLDTAVPHTHIFPHCDGIIHHGGSGTTHSASRAGKPQLVAPLLLDQFYWGSRVSSLGLGPGSVKIGKIGEGRLEKTVLDLMTNPSYREKAAALGEKIRAEGGVGGMCRFIENLAQAKALGRKAKTAE